MSSQTSSSPEKSGEEAEGGKEKGEKMEDEEEVFKIDEKKMKEVVEKVGHTILLSSEIV